MAFWASSGLKSVSVLSRRTYLYSKGRAAWTPLIHLTIESRLFPSHSLSKMDLKALTELPPLDHLRRYLFTVSSHSSYLPVNFASDANAFIAWDFLSADSDCNGAASPV